jgi:hypothetical protein
MMQTLMVKVEAAPEQAEALHETKRDKSIQVEFDLDGAMPYDQRIMSWKGLDRVSLLTLKGRLVLPIRVGEYYSDRMNRPRGRLQRAAFRQTLLCLSHRPGGCKRAHVSPPGSRRAGL